MFEPAAAVEVKRISRCAPRLLRARAVPQASHSERVRAKGRATAVEVCTRAVLGSVKLVYPHHRQIITSES